MHEFSTQPFTSINTTHSPMPEGAVVTYTCVAFHSGGDGTAANPRSACFTYDDRTPILAVDQGNLHLQVSPAHHQVVTEQDVNAASALAQAALTYVEALQAHYWGQPFADEAVDVGD
ncbi:hypothetical protein [Nocardiopsis trehalosi]|uniref:hypothetical protein n=1 Tax=Nocardiopsis trehalosi TaxID=109329 RepID=UPI000835ED7F|nr:hypothetical protein [Nocardiopsis trehalosi]